MLDQSHIGQYNISLLFSPHLSIYTKYKPQRINRLTHDAYIKYTKCQHYVNGSGKREDEFRSQTGGHQKANVAHYIRFRSGHEDTMDVVLASDSQPGRQQDIV